jgi:hypothetical protein
MTSRNIQNLFDWQEIRNAFPGADDAAVDDYYAKTILIKELLQGPQSGSGNPNGVVNAGATHFYIDTDVNQLYWNPNIGVNTGWVAL